MTQDFTQEQRVDFLIRYLLNEHKEYEDISLPASLEEKERLLRSLMNVRPPAPVSDDFLDVQDGYLRERLAERGVTRVQDAYLGERLAERGVTSLNDLIPIHPDLYLWQGDITTLEVGTIVNAANSQMMGCFVPCHGCIDNAIHTYAGVQLRLECARLMDEQKGAEPTGRAKITKAYNLPCRHVLHTVGPIIQGAVTQADRELRAACYRSCLDLAAAHGLRSVAFCCISTGEFHFPNELAARIAIQTAADWRQKNSVPIEVIFNVFKDRDYEIYSRLLR